MTRFQCFLIAAALVIAAAFSPTTFASQDPLKPVATGNLKGLHDFDFLVGTWHVHHRTLKKRLAGSQEWNEFDGTCVMQKLMNGWSNVDDNVLDRPEGSYRAVSLRSYDAKSGKWTIWWLDGRSPSANLDPPVHGSFENGIGTFFADDTLNGKPIRVRFVWSAITANSAHWQQAYSSDAGKTWEVNWEMDFKRDS